MALLPIITYPDPLLKKVSVEVERVDEDLQTLIDNMLETMYQAPGIGLAAPQVGRLIRLVVVDVPLPDDGGRTGPLALINPRIVEKRGTQVFEEGCLSLPNFTCEITRAATVVVQFLNRDGQPQEIQAEGLLAICLQHELDHLEGRLAVDYISSLKRALYRKRRQKREES